MKKHILLGAALLSLFAASCSNDDIINNDNEVVNGKTITLNATINNGADTRLAYTDNGSSMQVAWSNEESFTMYKGTITEGSTFSKTAESGSKFKGNDITGDGKYYAVYGGNHISNTGGTLSIDLSGAQVGTAANNGIKEFMLATADALTNETSLEFKHKLTVLKLTLTLPSDVTGPVNKVTVSGLHNKASYSLSADAYDAYADADKGDITATNGETGFEIKDNKITAYVAVFPENVSANQVTIKATVGYNEYYYTIAGARELAPGKVVPVNVTLTKRNFKSTYNMKDYFYWDAYTSVNNGDENTFGEGNYGYHTGSGVTASHSCASCPTASQMVAYLKAGVYWDDGAAGEGQMTYFALAGSELHTGLWVKKKSKIENFDSETFTGSSYSVTLTNLSSLSAGEIKDIRTGGDYFFLPATGYYRNSLLHPGGSNGYYWSSSPSGDDRAYFMCFYNNYAFVNIDTRDRGHLPMAAE